MCNDWKASKILQPNDTLRMRVSCWGHNNTVPLGKNIPVSCPEFRLTRICVVNHDDFDAKSTRAWGPSQPAETLASGKLVWIYIGDTSRYIVDIVDQDSRTCHMDPAGGSFESGRSFGFPSYQAASLRFHLHLSISLMFFSLQLIQILAENGKLVIYWNRKNI